MSKKIVRMVLMCLFVVIANNLMAQNSITGTVTDDTGSPLPGASVVVKGTTTGVITDFNGKFTLSVPANAKLVISFVGMNNTEVAVGNNKTINVKLVTSTVGVEEVVVTAMGITKAKKSLAYSVSEVKSDELVKAGNSNAMKSLDGKVSGVNLTSLSSDPTSSVLVNIRGTTAMPSTSDANVSVKGQPLYVIDGIPVGNQTFTSKNGVDFGNILSQLNTEDIENITILKGGSAGALYGSDGGNGVVMITTKSGKGGKKGIGVSFSTSATVDSPYQFIEEQQIFGQGERAYEWQYDNTDTWGPKLDGSYKGDFWNTKTQKWDNGPMKSSNENRMKAYLNDGSTVTTNVNVNGNYDKGSFRLSLSNMGNNGVMPNTKTNQKSITLASEYKLTDKIKITANANYTRTYSPNKANVTGSNSVLNSLLFNFPTNLQPLADMKNYWMTGFDGIQMNGAIQKDNGIDKSETNPWWSTYEKVNRFSRDNFFGKLQLDYKINKDFVLVLRSGIDDVIENYEYRQSFGNAAMANRSASGDGMFQTELAKSLSFNSDALLSYSKSVGKFDISAVGGVNYAYSNTSNYSITAGALSVPGLFTMGNVFPGKLTANYGWGAVPSYSVYGTADMSWNKQFFVGITGRNDWKGNLSEEKINYFYPSVSLAWIASETFKLPESINLLKVRLGLANVGNGLTKQRPVDRYSFDSPDWSGTVKTANISATLVDPDIKPMASITKEAGIDLWMLDKRVQFDFTYFRKDQNNQLGSIPVVQGTGFTGMTTNVGDVRNEGYEWGLTVTPIKNKDWKWDITASFTHYKAHIMRLSPKFAPAGYVFASYDGKTVVKIAEGEEIGNIYEQNPILKVKTGKYAGMPLLDGDAGEFQGSSNEKDRAQLGNYNPNYIMGFNSSVKYKNFTLNIVGAFRMGGKYVSVNQQYMDSNGRSIESLGTASKESPFWSGGRNAEYGGHAWPAAGSSKYESINANNDGQRTDEVADAGYAKGVFINPNFTGTTPSDADYIVNGADLKNTFYQFAYNSWGDCIWSFTSTRVYDATNFKLREVSLNYVFPSEISNILKINNLNISLIGRNLFQWNASGRNEDPESAFSGVGTNQGILRATLPSIRSIGFKLGFDF
ncbi:MAG: SusC/RagA family TonB-linked outer membrane protein [Prolixibacteraceae bacterium]